MSSPKWNRDVFAKIMESVDSYGKQLQLIDAMLADGNERQRKSILQWVEEIDMDLDMRVLIDLKLISLLLYRDYSEVDISRLYGNFSYWSTVQRWHLPMYKVLMGKLIQAGKMTNQNALSYLIAATHANQRDIVNHLLATFPFADWVKQVVSGCFATMDVMIGHGANPGDVVDAQNWKILFYLRDAKGVFNDPGKRIKRDY